MRFESDLKLEIAKLREAKADAAKSAVGLEREKTSQADIGLQLAA